MHHSYSLTCKMILRIALIHRCLAIDKISSSVSISDFMKALAYDHIIKKMQKHQFIKDNLSTYVCIYKSVSL